MTVYVLRKCSYFLSYINRTALLLFKSKYIFLEIKRSNIRFGNGVMYCRRPDSFLRLVIIILCWSHSQFGGLFGQAFGQRVEALVAAAHHRVQTGALCGTPQHWGAAVLVVT